MAEFVRVARLSDIPYGTMTAVKAKGRSVLLANIDGRAYAIGNRCTHMRGRLSKGKLQGTVVECAWHGAKYDVGTGRMVRGPQGIFAKVPGLGAANMLLTRVLPLRRGKVEERDGSLYVC